MIQITLNIKSKSFVFKKIQAKGNTFRYDDLNSYFESIEIIKETNDLAAFFSSNENVIKFRWYDEKINSYWTAYSY